MDGNILETPRPNPEMEAKEILVREAYRKRGSHWEPRKVTFLETLGSDDSKNPHFITRAPEINFHYFGDRFDTNTYFIDSNFNWPHKLEGDQPRIIRMEREQTLLICTTDESERELVSQIGWKALRGSIYKPELFDGQIIGRGSEGVVYSYKIGDRQYAVKIYDPEAQKRVNEFSSMTFATHSEPEFFRRFLFTSKVATALNELPLNHIQFTSLKEYAASHNYHITELGPEFSLSDIQRAFSTNKGMDENRKQRALEFAKSIGVGEEHIKQIEEELRKLEDIIFILKRNHIAPFYAGRMIIDPDAGNLLIKDFDSKTGKINFALVDQGQTEGHFQDPQAMLFYYEDFEAEKEYDKLYNKVRQDSQFSQIITKYNLRLPDVEGHDPHRSSS